MRRWVSAAVILSAILMLTWSAQVVGQSMSKNLTGKPVTIEGMKSATSSAWKEEKAEKPEIAKFIWPKGQKTEPEDGVMVVLPDLEGKDEDNIEAWKKMFQPSKGDKFADDDIIIKKAKVGNVNLTLLEVNGTYLRKKGSSAEPEKLPKFRMYSAIFDVKGKKYLIRAVGPVNTMKKNGSDFRAWLAAFK